MPEYDEIRTDCKDFSQLVPTQFVADLLLLLVKGEPVLAIVLEVQLDAKPEKLGTWPVYVAAARARFHCPACLVVVTTKRPVANWAKSAIVVGPGAHLQPIVIGPHDIPAIEDGAAARKVPELAILSAVAHAKDADPGLAARVAFAALTACLELDNERALSYADVVRALLTHTARAALDIIMQAPQHREFQSEFAKRYVAAGKAAGKAEGKAAGKAESVLRILARRGIEVTEVQRALVLGSADVEELERWLDRAIVAQSADQVFE